jgi:hypothetical protein
MKKVRGQVFETNSSSSHSIIIEMCYDTDILDTIIPDKDGNITLTGGEFGWGPESYNDALTKANYCLVDQREDDEKIDMLKKVIKEQTGCNEVLIDFNEWVYIDHQSLETSEEAFQSEEHLRGFIFNPNSELVIDHDNH